MALRNPPAEWTLKAKRGRAIGGLAEVTVEQLTTQDAAASQPRDMGKGAE